MYMIQHMPRVSSTCYRHPCNPSKSLPKSAKVYAPLALMSPLTLCQHTRQDTKHVALRASHHSCYVQLMKNPDDPLVDPTALWLNLND